MKLAVYFRIIYIAYRVLFNTQKSWNFVFAQNSGYVQERS